METKSKRWYLREKISMSTPVNFDDLIEIFSVNSGDQMITENEPEQATTRATVKQVQSIDLLSLDPLPSAMTAGDVFFGADNLNIKFSTAFQNITFPSGTKIWAFQASYPSGWKLVPDTGDKLLAIVGGSKYTTAGTEGGTWLTEGVNGGDPGGALTIEQIPAHRHRGHKTKTHLSSSAANNGKDPLRGKVAEDDSNFRDRYFNTEETGGGQPHNHGNAWRPRAQVGIIIEKI